MLAHSRQSGSTRRAHHPPFCSHWSSRFFRTLVMNLHDRAELLEGWIGLGLMVALVLALWLLPL
jgi:hypothetical protein